MDASAGKADNPPARNCLQRRDCLSYRKRHSTIRSDERVSPSHASIAVGERAPDALFKRRPGRNTRHSPYGLTALRRRNRLEHVPDSPATNSRSRTRGSARSPKMSGGGAPQESRKPPHPIRQPPVSDTSVQVPFSSLSVPLPTSRSPHSVAGLSNTTGAFEIGPRHVQSDPALLNGAFPFTCRARS
jgi:hypothetical protein